MMEGKIAEIAAEKAIDIITDLIKELRKTPEKQKKKIALELYTKTVKTFEFDWQDYIQRDFSRSNEIRDVLIKYAELFRDVAVQINGILSEKKVTALRNASILIRNETSKPQTMTWKRTMLENLNRLHIHLVATVGLRD